MTALDLIRATLPKRVSYDKECWRLAKHFLPAGSHAELDVLAQSIQWAVESTIDTMKFEEESEHGQ